MKITIQAKQSEKDKLDTIVKQLSKSGWYAKLSKQGELLYAHLSESEPYVFKHKQRAF